MTHSEQINELAAALAKAQGKIKGAVKDSANPFFKSKYADLSAVWDACRAAITSEGLSVVQAPRLSPPLADGMPWVLEVETRLLHASGQWMAETLGTPIEKLDAQGVGSATTYLRRYSLASFVGVAPEDDDGNAAVESKPKAAYQSQTSGFVKAADIKPKGYDGWVSTLDIAAGSGTPALEKAWKSATQEMRAYFTASNASKLDELKAKAAQAVSA